MSHENSGKSKPAEKWDYVEITSMIENIDGDVRVPALLVTAWADVDLRVYPPNMRLNGNYNPRKDFKIIGDESWFSINLKKRKPKCEGLFYPKPNHYLTVRSEHGSINVIVYDPEAFVDHALTASLGGMAFEVSRGVSASEFPTNLTDKRKCDGSVDINPRKYNPPLIKRRIALETVYGNIKVVYKPQATEAIKAFQ